MSFAAIQSEFAGFPESTATALSAGELFEAFMRIDSEKGGLIPQAMLPDMLGISKQRVSQLVADHRFEVHQIGRMKFVTGDSLAAYQADEKKHGRGHKAPRFLTVLRSAKKWAADPEGQKEDAA